MAIIFKTLSNEWNAEPNAPNPIVEVDGSNVVLSFGMNSFKYPKFRETDMGKIVFNDCWRYRLGPTNDEGWYLGQCRFSREDGVTLLHGQLSELRCGEMLFSVFQRACDVTHG